MTERTPTPAGQTLKNLAPVAAGERIDAIDIVRGFALLGILTVNMAYFSHSIYRLLAGLTTATTPVDLAVEWLIRFLAEGKFYSLFSFLFGLGLVLQMSRAEAHGVHFVPLYLRRLFGLLLIGLAHAFLIWTGDILVTYALLGVVLLVFRTRQPRTLLIWAGGCLLLPILMSGVAVGFLELLRRLPETAAEVDRAFAETAADYAARATLADRVYASGSYVEITVQRARDLAFFAPFLLSTVPSILAMFLLGLYAGRRRIAQEISSHLPLIRQTARWGLGVGLPLNLIYALASAQSQRIEPSLMSLIGGLAQTLGAPALSLGYAAAITLLVQQPLWRQRLAPLAAAGRLALSNYLLQSIVCTVIFYGYGLRLFGQVGAAAGLGLTLAIYGAQLLLSVWWLRSFRFGPAEWVWRSLTYGQWQPLRRDSSPQPVGDHLTAG